MGLRPRFRCYFLIKGNLNSYPPVSFNFLPCGMNAFRRSEGFLWLLPVLALVFCFFFMKWDALTLPFFWDELGVYGPGILAMLDNGVGLLPSSLEPELSRGHPLLFYAVFAGYSKLVGFSLLKIRLLALLISCSLFGSIWWIGRKMFGNLVGVLAAFTVCLMPVFYVQSTLVLPEMMLSLFVLWGLYHIYQKNWLWYAVFGSLAILTKETGILLPLAGITYLIFSPEKPDWKSIGFLLIPTFVFGLFLLIQKVQNGWFFFPYHTELISFNWVEISFKAGEMLHFLFVDQGRWLISIGILLAVFLAIRRKKLFSLPAVHSWFLLSSILFGGMMCFTVLNAYMDRYLLVLLPLMALGFAGLAQELLLLNVNKKLVRLSVLLPFLSFLLHKFYPSETFQYDIDRGFQEVVEVQQETTDYLMETVEAGDTVYTNFPLYLGFQDVRFGYVDSLPDFELTVRPDDPVSVIATMSPGVPWMGESLDSLEIVKEFKLGISHCEVYLVK